MRLSSPQAPRLADDRTLLNSSPRSFSSFEFPVLSTHTSPVQSRTFARIPKNVIGCTLDDAPYLEFGTTLQILKNSMRSDMIYVLEFSARNDDDQTNSMLDESNQPIVERLGLPFQQLACTLSPSSSLKYDAPLHLTLSSILEILKSSPVPLEIQAQIDITHTHIDKIKRRAEALALVIQLDEFSEEEMKERREAAFICRWEAALFGKRESRSVEGDGKRAEMEPNGGGQMGGGKGLKGLGLLRRYRVAVQLHF